MHHLAAAARRRPTPAARMSLRMGKGIRTVPDTALALPTRGSHLRLVSASQHRAVGARCAAVGEAVLPVGDVGGAPGRTAGTDLHRGRQPAVANSAPSGRAADAAEERLDIAPTQVSFGGLGHSVPRVGAPLAEIGRGPALAEPTARLRSYQRRQPGPGRKCTRRRLRCEVTTSSAVTLERWVRAPRTLRLPGMRKSPPQQVPGAAAVTASASSRPSVGGHLRGAASSA